MDISASEVLTGTFLLLCAVVLGWGAHRLSRRRRAAGGTRPAHRAAPHVPEPAEAPRRHVPAGPPPAHVPAGLPAPVAAGPPIRVPAVTPAPVAAGASAAPAAAVGPHGSAFPAAGSAVDAPAAAVTRPAHPAGPLSGAPHGATSPPVSGSLPAAAVAGSPPDGAGELTAAPVAMPGSVRSHDAQGPDSMTGERGKQTTEKKRPGRHRVSEELMYAATKLLSPDRLRRARIPAPRSEAHQDPRTKER